MREWDEAVGLKALSANCDRPTVLKDTVSLSQGFQLSALAHSQAMMIAAFS
jgi:hypothetical protein